MRTATIARPIREPRSNAYKQPDQRKRKAHADHAVDRHDDAAQIDGSERRRQSDFAEIALNARIIKL
jgi:hypothetical protein